MLKTRTKVVGLALTVAGIGTAYAKQDIIFDYMHSPLTQEQLIGDTLLKAYGSEVNVRCLTPEELDNRVWPFGIGMENKKGATPFLLPSLMWLDQEVCDDFQAFAALSDKSHLTDDQVEAVRVITHEDRHRNGTMFESTAECETAQSAFRIPLALGANIDTAVDIGRQVAERIVNDTSTPGNYKVEDCYNGGPHDLNLSPAIFPSVANDTN